MINKHKKTSLALLLSFALGCSLPMGVYANSGGTLGAPSPDSYTGFWVSGSHVIIDTTGIFTVNGGYSAGDENVTNNKVEVSGHGVTVSYAYGGYSNGGSDASGNTVDISSGAIAEIATGGYSNLGNSNSNTVNISGGSRITEIARGGKGNNVNNNTVSISDSTAKAVYCAISSGGTANNNTVYIYNSSVPEVTAVNTEGRTIVDADNNTVIVSAGSVVNILVGASLRQGDATNNSIYISDSTADVLAGGSSTNGNANNNRIDISDSTVASLQAAYANNGNANNNTVIIKNSTVAGYIYAAEVQSSGTATHNTVTIENLTTATENVTIYGGYEARFTGNDLFTGNTINWTSKNTIAKVGNFEYYNFTVPENVQAGETLLSVTDTAGTSLNNSKIKLQSILGKNWNKGDTVTLISNENGLSGHYELINGKITSGLRKYLYELSTNDDTTGILATIIGAGLGDQTESLSDGRIAAIGTINTAADLASGSGLQNAIDNASIKYEIFGAMNYSDSRYDSGSHVDVKGTSMLLGFSRKIEAKNSNWIVGAFLESGNSSYDTVNHFADFDGDVRANGKNNYFGGGIMARNMQNSGMYVDGSLRFGRISTDYNSADIDTKYDIKSTYYALHVGVGKVFKLNNSNNLDVYGKYFWSHQNAATTSIDGENFNFHSLDSHRLRIGARLNMLGGSNGIKTYVGLAYEHEFSGSARATYMGESVAAPSIKGSTGIGEIGMTYKPSSKSAFSMDIGLNGFIGKRQGIGGGVKLSWGF